MKSWEPRITDLWLNFRPNCFALLEICQSENADMQTVFLTSVKLREFANEVVYLWSKPSVTQWPQRSEVKGQRSNPWISLPRSERDGGNMQHFHGEKQGEWERAFFYHSITIKSGIASLIWFEKVFISCPVYNSILFWRKDSEKISFLQCWNLFLSFLPYSWKLRI